MSFNPVPKSTFKKRKPSLANRGRFSKKIIAQIINRDGGLCVICKAPAVDIHHVKYKSRGGRGVFTNGICICRKCHDKAHSSAKETERLEQMMINKYGEDYYKDEYDKE